MQLASALLLSALVIILPLQRIKEVDMAKKASGNKKRLRTRIESVIMLGEVQALLG
jgi:hypothetical protein